MLLSFSGGSLLVQPSGSMTNAFANVQVMYAALAAAQAVPTKMSICSTEAVLDGFVLGSNPGAHSLSALKGCSAREHIQSGW